MPLTPIQPGLRAISNGSNDVAKVSLVVPQGDVLCVSEVVADQLVAASGAFKRADEAPAAESAPADDGEAGEAIEQAVAPRARRKPKD